MNSCMLEPALRRGRDSPSTSSDEILPTRPKQRKSASRPHSSFSGPAIGSFLASTPNQQGCRTRTLSSHSLSSITVPSLSDFFPSRRPYSAASQCILLQHFATRICVHGHINCRHLAACRLSFGNNACSVRSRRRVENGPAALWVAPQVIILNMCCPMLNLQSSTWRRRSTHHDKTSVTRVIPNSLPSQLQ